MHIFFVGNPGVGKSFIINAVIGQPYFPSGVSLCHGLTRNVLHFRSCAEGVSYVDTPGLDDLVHRSEAAEALSDVLSVRGDCKLVFVTALSDGRVRPADLTALRLIVQALRQSGVSPRRGVPYALLVNKCAGDVVCTRGDGSEEDEDEGEGGDGDMEAARRLQDEVVFAFSTVAPVNHVAFFPVLPYADGGSNIVLHGEEAYAYRRFIEDAPVFHLPALRPVTIDTTAFDDAYTQIKVHLHRMTETIERLQRRREQTSVQTAQRSLPCSEEDLRALFEVVFWGSVEDGDRGGRGGRGGRGEWGGTSGDWKGDVLRFCVNVGMPLLRRLLGNYYRRGETSTSTGGSTLVGQSSQEPAVAEVLARSVHADEHVVD